MKTRQCQKCGSTEKVTKHSIAGNHKAPFVYLCQSCHDEEHGITRHDDIKSVKRRMRRAKHRVKRDLKIMEEARLEITRKELKQK